MKELKERCEKQAMLLISRTLLNKYDFEPSSIIDINLGSLIFPGCEHHGLPSPSSNKTDPPGKLNANPSRKEASKGKRVHCEQAIYDKRQNVESEEKLNPMPDKLTFKRKGKNDMFVCSFLS